MPAHLSHILQPLHVACLSPLRRKYSQRVRDLARRRIFRINTERFLPAFKDAFFDVFTEEKCRKAFKASGLLPNNEQTMLNRLEVRSHTPPACPPKGTPPPTKTLSNTHDFGSRPRRVRESFTQSPVTVEDGCFLLIEVMSQRNKLQVSQIAELEEQLEEMTKRKARCGGDGERAQPAVRRCGNCKEIGHNARACTRDTEMSSESDVSEL